MGAMDWLKGMMGPSAQFPGQQPGPGLGGLAGIAAPLAQAALGNPLAQGPFGGAQPPFQGSFGGAAPPFGGATPPFGAGDPYGGGGAPPNGYGTGIGGAPGAYPTAGDALAANAGYAGAGAFGGAQPPYGVTPGGSPREAALEAEVAALRHDVESLALFARTLLTAMVERKVIGMDEFQATKNKIDMLDGKLDDKVAKGA